MHYFVLGFYVYWWNGSL